MIFAADVVMIARLTESTVGEIIARYKTLSGMSYLETNGYTKLAAEPAERPNPSSAGYLNGQGDG